MGDCLVFPQYPVMLTITGFVVVEDTVLVIEPDSSRSKQVVAELIAAGYDALVVSHVDEAIRQLYQAAPDAVILSDRLSVADFDRLSDAISTVTNLPLIELSEGASLDSVSRRLTSSTGLEDLTESLQQALQEGTPRKSGHTTGTEAGSFEETEAGTRTD